jgi:hypothetical protein
MNGPENQPVDLGSLDPGSSRPDYWDRFHAGVMAGAELPLARRRAAAEPHIPDLLFQWGRMVAPVAAAAALLAAVALTRGGPVVSDEPIPVEDLLAVDFAPEEGLGVALTSATVGTSTNWDW